MRLVTLLLRSEALHKAFDQAVGGLEGVSSEPRDTVTLDALMVSRQHADALRMLLSEDLGSTAIGVLRMQYEALLRATWVLFAASPQAVASLAAPLTPGTSRAASSLGLPGELLKSIEKSPAPDDLKRVLREFRMSAWDVTNSYIHAGIHPLRRHVTHHEHELTTALRLSNGLVSVSCALIVIVAQAPSRQADINIVSIGFPECLPPRHAP